jgi:CRISPR/Cas system-associated exonuclease Cas4 (RecB family)
MLIEKILDYERSKIKQWPVVSNRASELGHECIRYLCLNRTRWQEKTLHSVETQMVFDEGHTQERAVTTLLNEVGFKLIEQQRAFEWAKYQITGTIDAKVLVGDPVRALPLEIKSCSPFSFQRINTIEDLYKGKYHYLRMYPAQMTLYLLLDNKEEGLFLFKNKATGALKEIPMALDYDLGESLLKKAETINQYVDNPTTCFTLPDCIPYDEQICGNCGYIHICLPEVKRTALTMIEDLEIEAKLKRRDELKPYTAEYDRLDRELKALFKECDRMMVGDYLITGKWIDKKAFTVQASKYWQSKIQSLITKGEINE